MNNSAPSPAVKFLDRALAQLPRGVDPTLLILKTHLVVEEALNEVLTQCLHNPEHLFRARLSFSQRLKVLQALAPYRAFHDLAEAIELLNSVRNTLAHQLAPSKHVDLIPKFIEVTIRASRESPDLVELATHWHSTQEVSHRADENDACKSQSTDLEVATLLLVMLCYYEIETVSFGAHEA